MDFAELKRALDQALRKASVMDVVRSMEPPISNPFFWPDPELRDIEVELFSLVVSHWKSGWRMDDRSMQMLLKQMLWDAYREPAKEGQLAAAVEAFLSQIQVPIGSFEILVALEGLHPPKSAIPVPRAKIGLLMDLVEPEVAKEVTLRSESKFPVWCLLKVDAPSEVHVAAAGATAVEEALDFLATLDQRSREFRGNPAEVRLGPVGFIIDTGGQLKPFVFRNEWGRSWGYSVDPETAENKPRLHYRTGPFPWEDLPKGNELSENLQEAYRRFGHARRLAHDPEAAIPLAISALETLLSIRNDKKHAAAGRLILASIALDAATMWPLELVAWFEHRNKILHVPFYARWTEREALRALWSLYGVLDLVSHFIVTQKVSTQKDLLDRLLTSENVDRAKKAIGRQIDSLKDLLAKALTPSYKKHLGLLIETWQDIGKSLEARV